MSLNSAGNEGTKAVISSGFETSSFTMWTLTPAPTSSDISFMIVSKRSRRRAVSISLRFDEHVRANSKAVLLPMPELAPVIRTVFPDRLADAEVGIMA